MEERATATLLPKDFFYFKEMGLASQSKLSQQAGNGGASAQNSYGTPYASLQGYSPPPGPPPSAGNNYGNPVTYVPPTGLPFNSISGNVPELENYITNSQVNSTPQVQYQPPPGPPGGQPYNFQGNANNYVQPQGTYGIPIPQTQSFNFQEILDNVIRSKNLSKFYPNSQSYQTILNKLYNINFARLSTEWRLNPQICSKLAALSLYDIIVLCDDSGSMAFEEQGSRIDDLKMILERIAQIATLFDDDGILIRFMNSNLEGNGITNQNQVNQLMQGIQFNGLTPIGTELERKILQPFFVNAIERRQFNKPLLVFVITDGEPAGESRDKVYEVISNAVRIAFQSGYGAGLAIQFAQVGKDQGAQRFLAALDNNSVIKDVVDTTSYYELEADEIMKKGGVLTPELWLVKLMLGAIDPFFDSRD